jgi:ureidoacrylate peracid hydrolase
MNNDSDDTLPADLVRLAIYLRDRPELFDSIDPRRTAMLVVDMQNAFLADGAPFETPAARALVPKINRIAAALRRQGGAVIWIQHTAGHAGKAGYWPLYFENFVRSGKRGPAIDALAPDTLMHALYSSLDVEQGDLILPKHRFSAFLRTPHDLEALLIGRGVDTLIVTGTATNVCVESTVRDAMMRDFRVFMPHDGTAAQDSAAHLAGVRNVMQSFADVRPVNALLNLIEPVED